MLASAAVLSADVLACGVLACGVLACGVLLSLAVLGADGLLARGAVHARASRLGGAVLLRVSVLGRAVRPGRGLSVGGLLRLRVPACTVLAARVLSGGVLGRRGLIPGEVLDGGDELTDAEFAVALLLRLAVPDIVMVQVGRAALSPSERTRLSVLSDGGLLVGRLLIRRPVLGLPLLLAGLLLRGRVLARFVLRVTRLLEPAACCCACL